MCVCVGGGGSGSLYNGNLIGHLEICYLSRDMRFPTMWYVRPTKPQISLHIRFDSMTVKLLNVHYLEFLSLKRGWTGWS